MISLISAQATCRYLSREMLANAPVRPEGGVHDFLFTLARVLHPWRAEDWVN